MVAAAPTVDSKSAFSHCSQVLDAVSAIPTRMCKPQKKSFKEAAGGGNANTAVMGDPEFKWGPGKSFEVIYNFEHWLVF